MPKNSGITLAVVHGVIELGKPEHNIGKIEEVLERARSEGVELLLLPSMINGTPIFELWQGIRVKRVAETIPGKTSDYLAGLANKFGVHILVGPILERRGSKIYRSAFVVEPSMNIKFVASQIVAPAGFGQSSAIPIHKIMDVNVGIFIAEDVHLPELSLLMKIVGVDIAVFYPYPNTSPDRILSTLKVRALELKAMVISVGCTVMRKSEELMFMPTAIVDENGSVLHEVLDRNTKMIKMVIPCNQRREMYVSSTAYKKLLKTLNKTLSYYLRDL
uniref:Carbon-nitrogen hydrolase family protein n=1 Tax=Ignisphaera aggregans TaxID=334771 RepID=A0A7C2V968_9CREN